MSKVIHLPEDAHRLAKKFCAENGLRMSDWVGALINEACDHLEAVAAPPSAKKKVLEKLGNTPQTDADGVPVVEKPPFWKGQR
jgi:hypothetical protein